eukprot:CAMPEP_0184486264 /NCGR_PEP_ID=MMETSP0113_2-20130426/7782_1 /TAXON_ID=91329 /ORGANISM="Norrisiella sphaerica, Strain BC52" /LENGTH=766 /DNA_ID=CAMNT_0026868053 /DNA_START=580 /DNA_END=2880 /DNA_ORIENTATION=+
MAKSVGGNTEECGGRGYTDNGTVGTRDLAGVAGTDGDVEMKELVHNGQVRDRPNAFQTPTKSFQTSRCYGDSHADKEEMHVELRRTNSEPCFYGKHSFTLSHSTRRRQETIFAIYYSNCAMHIFRAPNEDCAVDWVHQITRAKAKKDPKWLRSLPARLSIASRPRPTPTRGKEEEKKDAKDNMVEGQQEAKAEAEKGKWDEDALNQLFNSGFKPEHAIWAYEASGKELDRAITILCHSYSDIAEGMERSRSYRCLEKDADLEQKWMKGVEPEPIPVEKPRMPNVSPAVPNPKLATLKLSQIKETEFEECTSPEGTPLEEDDQRESEENQLIFKPGTNTNAERGGGEEGKGKGTEEEDKKPRDSPKKAGDIKGISRTGTGKAKPLPVGNNPSEVESLVGPDEEKKRSLYKSEIKADVESKCKDPQAAEVVFNFHGALYIFDNSAQRWSVRPKWFYLENCRLFWSNTNSLVANGALCLSPAAEIEHKDGSSEFFVHLKTGSLQLRCESESAASGWVMALRRGRQMLPWDPTPHTNHPPMPPRDGASILINDSDQGILKMEVTIQPLIRTIFHEEVFGLAQAGDILLFRTNGTVLSGLTRSVTASPWDHIGLVVGESTHDDLRVIEALTNGGVQISRFSQFYNCAWYKQYSSVALRRLVGPREKIDVTRRLEKFAKDVDGKKYQVKFSKMIYSWVWGPDGGPPVNELDKDTYCCSEVIAAAYKELGILRPDIDAVAYVPGSFGSDRSILLLEGFRLENEIEIKFSKSQA